MPDSVSRPRTRSLQSKRVLITDLDNTLWDWVDIWYRSFSAMLDRLIDLSGMPRKQLEAEIRAVHQRHGTSEYAFLLDELPSLRLQHPGKPPSEVYRPAIDAFRTARRESLALYAGVEEGLTRLRAARVLLVGYTESMAFYTNYRLRHTGLDSVLDYVYSPEDHELPRGMSREELRRYPKEHYQLARTEHRYTPAGELKPNPHVLLSIIADIGTSPDHCVYVGDSKLKDIPMAQDAGVTDVWAQYGRAQHREEYDLLRRVTHWTDEDVRREREILARGEVTPTHSIQRFDQVLELFSFEAMRA